jgi:hypothetical protein
LTIIALLTLSLCCLGVPVIERQGYRLLQRQCLAVCPGSIKYIDIQRGAHCRHVLIEFGADIRIKRELSGVVEGCECASQNDRTLGLGFGPGDCRQPTASGSFVSSRPRSLARNSLY